ncbi:MAG: DUF1287 domain-containing protein, partial [Myxococcales bacterium]|nr:DUF1287 domain-containing protein [Myxococcales bacterium]
MGRACWLGLVLVSLPAYARSAHRVPASDRGVFKALTARVRLHTPSWLSRYPQLVLRGAAGQRFLAVDGTPVAYARASENGSASASASKGAKAYAIPFGDADRDGIPDTLDILIGAKKAALNGARYQDGYFRIKYPGGDVPRTLGVCTDVVIRALRNAGFDLQRLVARDVRRRRSAYRRIKKPDRNIDHRRVSNLLVWFRRHFAELPVSPDAPGSSPLLPGDVIFFDTMNDPAPEHLGIVSDRVGRSGKPLIINNWTVGYHTQEMDLLASVRATHRFRVRAPRAAVGATVRALLDHYGLRLPSTARQLIVSSTPRWAESATTLRRLRRDRAGHLLPVGRALAGHLGRAGLGRGRGLHDAQRAATTSAAFRRGPAKRE